MGIETVGIRMHEWIRCTPCLSSYESLTVEVLCGHSGELQGCYRGVRVQSTRPGGSRRPAGPIFNTNPMQVGKWVVMKTSAKYST